MGAQRGKVIGPSSQRVMASVFELSRVGCGAQTRSCITYIPTWLVAGTGDQEGERTHPLTLKGILLSEKVSRGHTVRMSYLTDTREICAL